MRKRHFEPVGFQGARIPVYRRWIPVRRKFGSGEIYLVGDAAGQVKVTTVGGIVTGFRGALGVAKSILHRKQSPELRSLRRELNAHLMLRKSLHHFQQADYSRLVDLLNDSARRSVAHLQEPAASGADGATRTADARASGAAGRQPLILLVRRRLAIRGLCPAAAIAAFCSKLPRAVS
jgi:flavin-dependent dehydrogenase